MAAAPRISVVMPVYNAERYLREAIDSLLAQTFGDFELVAVDDGSKDRSAAIVESYRDPRIVLHRNPANMGVARTVNRGVQLARGAFIARMDADDISLPERLERQLRFLESHPGISVVGTDIERIDPEGRPIAGRFKNPGPWGAVKWHLLINNCLAHPTIMARREFFDSGGLYEDVIAEDYSLWLRAAERNQRLCNLPDVLLRYRVHPGSVSLSKYAGLHRSSGELLSRYARLRLGYDMDVDLAEDCLRLADRRIPFLSLLRIAPFYAALAWGCFRDNEARPQDALFILRRVASRLGKGFFRALAAFGRGTGSEGGR